jgi:hypothetical protein
MTMFPLRKQVKQVTPPIAKGIIVISGSTPDLAQQYKSKYTGIIDTIALDKTVIDMVNDLSREQFFILLEEMIDDRQVDINRISHFEKTDLTGVDKTCLIGVIPWIMTTINYIPVKKEEGYVTSIKPLMEESREFLLSCHTLISDGMEEEKVKELLKQ